MTLGISMSQDVAQWRTAATSALPALRGPDGGWPYRTGAESATEPSALAALALSGTAEQGNVSSVADWLIARQQEDGFFTAATPYEVGSWLTPLAAMALTRLGRTASAAAAAEALLAAPVHTFTQFPAGIYGYDTSLAGWPWSSGAFSFVEPTALTVLFLKQAGHGNHERVRQAVDMLRDRALAAGGWNYGEPLVLGGELYPAEAPTALSLLALADEQDERTDKALAWLRERRGQITSLYSLGWAAVVLNVLGAMNGEWRDEIAARWSGMPAERRDAVGTALCLLGMREGQGHPFGLS